MKVRVGCKTFRFLREEHGVIEQGSDSLKVAKEDLDRVMIELLAESFEGVDRFECLTGESDDAYDAGGCGNGFHLLSVQCHACPRLIMGRAP